MKLFLPFLALLSLSAGCGGTKDLGTNGQVSDCGGFPQASEKSVPPPSEEDEDCGDDTLEWSYDSASETVSLLNKGVFLNCCGTHSVTVDLEEAVYVVTEVDDPESDGLNDLRCGCMCSFDYSVEVPDIAEGDFVMRIVRSVSDQTPAVWTAWEGTLDLTQGSGEELIEAQVGWCDDR